MTARTTIAIRGVIFLALALALTHCGSSMPASPTSSAATVTSVALSASRINKGTTISATISLAVSATDPVSVTLASSNPAVASVPGTLTIAAGNLTAVATVTGVAAGAATITASFADSSQSASLTVVNGPALASLTLSGQSVIGGGSVTATAQLDQPAPAGGALVTITGGDPLQMPASVFVPATATSVPFVVMTRVVNTTVTAILGGSYGGATASATLVITPPTVATANFGVTGPSQTDTCMLADGGQTINCLFDGSSSTAPAPITQWIWSYGFQTPLATQTTTGPTLTNPTATCSLLPPPPLPEGASWLKMTVSLVVKDSLGNISTPSVHTDVRLFPQGFCGY